ncbi:hypothetical protein NDA13_006573 [Ustilago tritici]|nr:hypothetical protein NDA13_006573 [Ustilago tritici]
MIAAHYPTQSRNTKSQDSMVTAARSIIHFIPILSHHGKPSLASASTSSSVESEKSRLIPPILTSAATNIVRSYGAITHRKQERKEELKRLISRPISQEERIYQTYSQNARSREEVEERQERVEGEQSMGSVYSTGTWANETDDELDRVGDAFEFDIYCRGEKVKEDRSSIQTFASSERSYTFF